MSLPSSINSGFSGGSFAIVDGNMIRLGPQRTLRVLPSSPTYCFMESSNKWGLRFRQKGLKLYLPGFETGVDGAAEE